MAGVETDTASRMEKAVVNREGGRFEIVHVFVLFQRGLKWGHHVERMEREVQNIQAGRMAALDIPAA